jgi:mevalonate kinase
MPAISSSAPGKVILCGEHAVVYGQPAIALPVLDISTRCVILAKPNSKSGEVRINDPSIGLDSILNALPPNHPLRKIIALVLSALSIDHLPACEIQIHSTIPVGGGLGSSASVSVALTRAIATFVGHALDNESVNDIAFEIEKLHHNTPSGIDNSVITYAKPVFYIKGTPIQWLEIDSPMYFLIANSGIKGSTSKAVAQVRENWKSATAAFESIFHEIGETSYAMRETLKTGSLDQTGKLMTANHALLQRIGVSLPQLDNLVNAAIDAGAYGAKLSGGGLGGNVLVLVPPERGTTVSQALNKNGAVNIIPTGFNLDGAVK